MHIDPSANNNVTCYILCDSFSAIRYIDKIDTCIPLHNRKRLKILCEQWFKVSSISSLYICQVTVVSKVT